MKRDTLEDIARLRPSAAGARVAAERSAEAVERLAQDGELAQARRELEAAEAAEREAAERPARAAPQSGARAHAIVTVARGKREASAEAVQSLARKPKNIPTELELVRPLAEAKRRDMKTELLPRGPASARPLEPATPDAGSRLRLGLGALLVLCLLGGAAVWVSRAGGTSSPASSAPPPLGAASTESGRAEPLVSAEPARSGLAIASTVIPPPSAPPPVEPSTSASGPGTQASPPKVSAGPAPPVKPPAPKPSSQWQPEW